MAVPVTLLGPFSLPMMCESYVSELNVRLFEVGLCSLRTVNVRINIWAFPDAMRQNYRRLDNKTEFKY